VTHLLRAWREATAACRPRLAVLLDYDGTLVPIAPTPAQAVLPARVRTLLRILSRLPQTRVGIISGRSLREIERCVRVPGVVYAGNHGLELRGPQLSFVHPGATRSRALLRAMADRLDAALRPMPGAWVERKGLTISVHWRAVPRAEQAAFRAIVSAATAPEARRRAIQVTRGKRVVEIRPPVAWDKGRLVAWMAKRLSGRGRPDWTLWYAGDDETDEEAFRAVNRLQGLSVFVGARPKATAAAYWLRGPREVERWLQLLGRLRRSRTYKEDEP